MTLPPVNVRRKASLSSRIRCVSIPASLDEAGDHERRHDRVLAAAFAVARVLVGLHLRSVVAIWFDADCGRHAVANDRRGKFVERVVAFGRQKLGELLLPDLW